MASIEPKVANDARLAITEEKEDRASSPSSNERNEEHVSDAGKQAGVQRVEATTSTWSQKHLIAAYVIIWLIYFVTSTQEVVIRVLTPFVTSTFARHSLTATINIVASVVGGLSKIPLAKILDTWGRPQGLALMTLIWVLGFIMMAACKNVETYAAAHVFAAVGAQGVSYCLTVFIADTSSLHNRSLMLAFATSPYIVTTWIGGPISDQILAGPGWRWGFGIWAIVTPFVVAPLCVLFLWDQHKAKQKGVLSSSYDRLTPRSIWRYTIEVDLMGIIILAGGMALFLLSLSLYSYQKDQWRSPMIICMVVFGLLLIAGFFLYEKFFAPVQFIPAELLVDRTVFFGGLMFTFVFFSSAIWNGYFSSMLVVAFNQRPSQTTYILNIYRVGSCFSALIIGVLIRHTRRFKWAALYFALPLMILGVGLMIHFRQPNSAIGYIVMTQIFVAFAGGPIVIAGEMAMMAPSDHQHIAAIIAILDLFGSIGTAMGYAVSAAIWTGRFRPALEKYLPPGSSIDAIYGSIYSQLGYPIGSPVRTGIARAYADAQKYMLIASTCLLAGAVVCVVLWRDIKLDRKQSKGLLA